jgi:hypothetical protein
MRAQDEGLRIQVIRAWQAHFKLQQRWAFECAWSTLTMWDRFPETQRSLQWFGAPRARNLADDGLESFTFRVERQFHHGLDFGWFKQSVHGALEANLEQFGKTVGAEDLGKRRRPKDLDRAFECLALRVCQGLSPTEISQRPKYRRDWTTLSRDIKSAAELVGLEPPPRGRPPRKLAP